VIKVGGASVNYEQAVKSDESGAGHQSEEVTNILSHRLSTGGMEEVLSGHRDVVECAVIGIADPLKGEVPCGFIVTASGRLTPALSTQWGGCPRRAREKFCAAP
jgi:propionyl-CoA synthetase